MTAALAALVVLLSGCGLVLGWHQPGADPRTFARDKYECVREAQYMESRSGSLGAWSQPMTDFALYRTCMEARGWERKVGGYSYIP